MMHKLQKIALFTTCVVFAHTVQATDGYLTEAEAQSNFNAASEKFQQKQMMMDTQTSVEDEPTEADFVDQNMARINAEAETAEYKLNIRPALDHEMVNLQDAPVMIDVENKTLKAVMAGVVRQVVPYTGKWEVRWRLSPDNHFIVNERVNLTAETTFGEFVEFLTDRVNNMTGVQMFVKVFNSSRLIVISDTYY